MRWIKCSSVAEINKQYLVHTLLLDATLPGMDILQAYYPAVDTIADLKVPLPAYVKVKQLLDAPTSATKLGIVKNPKRPQPNHLAEMQRYIWQRWHETGRGKTLVITQMKAEEALKQFKLPPNVVIEHYKNISGIDDYRDIRLLIMIGRAAPGPLEIEPQAGALSGQLPSPCPAKGNGFIWFPSVKRDIQLRDGRSVKTTCDQHPDDFAEQVRWQIIEAELIQAFGRARAVNRTVDHPLDIDMLFNAALPIPVDYVEVWKPPSLLLETAINEGVMLTAPCDLTKLWPALWPNEKAADRTLKAGAPELPGFVEVTYQLRGPKKKLRVGYFDLAVIPDPRAWLEARLGPLAPV
jgi:putative DNA primase/helicase